MHWEQTDVMIKTVPIQSTFPYSRKYVVINVCDDEEYEKNVVFYIELGEPRLVKTAAGETDKTRVG